MAKAEKPAKEPRRKKAPAATPSPAAPRPLTPQQKLFALEYLRDLNATQAAIRAGYSAKRAAEQGYALLQIPTVRIEVDKEMLERATRIKRDADGLLQRLWDEADADIADIHYEDGTLRPMHEWPKVFRTGLVAGVDIEEIWEGTGKDRVKVGEIKKPRYADRARRLELIGRHHSVQAWKDSVKTDLADPIKQLAEAIAGKSIRPKEE